MRKLVFLGAIILSSCGGSNSTGESDPLELSKEALIGHWKLTKLKVGGNESSMRGIVVRQYKSDGTYVDAGENYYAEGNHANPCWYAGLGRFEIKGSGLVETVEKEVGPEKCTDGDFNSKSYATTISTTSITSKAADGTEFIYEKYAAQKDLDYTNLLEKFEKVTLTTDDPDRTNGLNLIYRSPRQGGWTATCPRLHGSETSGFTVSATFTYSGAVHEILSQWDEGDINPANYSGAAPSFSFQKRAATSSDAGGGIGSGRYSCSSSTDCQAKCALTISGYSLTDGTATMTYSCSALTASNNSDPDNLYGSSMTNTTFKAECNYKPSLDL